MSSHVTPRKIIEKQRVFEFLITYFDKETENCTTDPNIMYTCASELKTKLKKEDNEITNENNDDDLDILFQEINSNIEKHSSEYTFSTSENDEDLEINDDTDDADNNVASNNSSKLKHHKYALLDMIKESNLIMEKRNFNNLRQKKKERQMRNEKFVSNLYESILSPNNKNRKEVDWLNDKTNSLGIGSGVSFHDKFQQLKLK